MGNVSSKADDGSVPFLKDQDRLAIASVQICNAHNKVLYSISPNSFPAARYNVKRESAEDALVEYIQDPDTTSGSPFFLLKINNDDDIVFNFTFTMRQSQTSPPVDTIINSLTFIFASTPKDLATLITREFNADPNLHKNPNVDLVGNYSTNGKSADQFEWTWKWQPPKSERDKGGGWRNACSFVEYDQRAHRLNTLISFSFWVQNYRPLGSPRSPPTRELSVPTRLRLPSAQSLDSRLSDSKLSDSESEMRDARDPPSPIAPIPEDGLQIEPVPSNTSNASGLVKVDINYQRPEEDISAVEDGPIFRQTMKQLEQKTGNMRMRMKKVIKRAEAAKESQDACNDCISAFMQALREASRSNANAVQPAIDHYFEKIATEILAYERENAENLQKLIIEPLSRLYANDIKQAEAKRKDFDEESRDYYNYVSRYLGQRQDSMKDKKRAESDSKYENKRKNFELKRFDYSSFMQDLHGGRKEQDVLSQLTRYADAQAHTYLDTAKRIEALIPQLDALCFEVNEANKQYQLIRTGREEKRRTLEKSVKVFDPDGHSLVSSPNVQVPGNSQRVERSTNGIPDRPITSAGIPNTSSIVDPASATTTNVSNPLGSPPTNRFKGIRDLEEKDSSVNVSGAKEALHKKEGLLWSLSRPGGHIDPIGINKQGWHKYWVVLDQGKLLEYVNWKQSLELHREPIDLRVASVREARNAERRFCFEVITPNFTRVYQAPAEDEMRTWIQAINNALQNAFEMKNPPVDVSSSSKSSSIARDLFGKSSSFHGHRSSSISSTYLSGKAVSRNATVGERPALSRRSSEDEPARLLKLIRDADAGNAWCADCNAESKVEWVSINLGIIVCIECSGIHRSLGTHISKIRSLTLDTSSFTQDMVEMLLQIGNRVSNMIWEANLDRSPTAAIQKPTATASRDQRLRFISAKYADRAFVNPVSGKSADESLLASIKTNHLQNVLHALACHANPNATDLSRSTHSVFLALAAADPAAITSSPGQSASNSPAGSRAGSVAPDQLQTQPQASAQPRKSFAVAELLTQNGAEIPPQLPQIPLSRSAMLYVEFKREQKLGRLRPSAAPPSAASPAVAPASSTAMAASAPAASPAAPVTGYRAAGRTGHVKAQDSEGDGLSALPRFDPKRISGKFGR